ncbi:calcineurin-like phosphoesterase family protein [Chitinophaga dinghuensis]|uniref:Calcineurin-like phosphoesterase family protein n=1 Tax=Chitinophaga dinghuensis TaxID=1539050 RepID=A0A327W9I3_9BACT|nr:BamA/TamA family outer membrane protein [Chitinophaga dinghuensis]RAJ86043.1 calcineurin-like phosphoesterase family protein [Chitinophaga dinghuensis]
MSVRYLSILLMLLPFTLLAQSGEVKQRIILIGDAGELHENGRNPVIDAVRSRFDMQDKRNTVLFLGDNVYPLGLPDSLSKRYPVARQILDYQINLVRGTNARGFIIPGNHDWEKSKPDGWATIRNQQAYVDSLHLPNVTFFPKEGCPGPEEVNLSKDVTLIIMDSEWWLFPYEKPGVESDCDCKTKDEVLVKISEIVAKNRNKLIIFATHHPFRSYGIHGGYYTIKQHIFPLTDMKPWMYLPLPVIGSIYPLTRGVFGTPEDLPHPLYKDMVSGVEAATKQHGPVIFVSGHDHTLQLIKDDGNSYVVSGSGAKNNRVKMGSKSSYATCKNGFSVLELMADSTVRVQFFLADSLEKPAYTDNLLRFSEFKEKGLTFQQPDTLPKVISFVPDSQYNDVGRFHRWLLGNNYRQIWATPLNFPVLDLRTAKGGLKILQRGGGMQTRSLRVADSSGTEYTMRSLKKYPLAAIPPILRETIAREVVQDQISASNPYATLSVAVLAEAAKVPHTNPTFIYLPKDTMLGIYANDFGGDVYLFEEREPETGDKDKSYNTLKVLAKTQGDNDYVVDQKSVLRARILDTYITDYDRHDDQWRWYREKHKGVEYYYPVPRDRDQAFFINEGFLPRVVATPSFMPQFYGFRRTGPWYNGWNFSTRYFDRTFLIEPDEAEWRKQTRKFVDRMTDSVLEASVNALPDTIRHLVNPYMLNTLKARRAVMEDVMLKYYRFLSKVVYVPATAKNELIELDKQANGGVALNIYKISKKGEVKQNIFSRTFDPRVTKELNIYGLGGQDQWLIKGNYATPIRIRLIGGPDADTYTDSSSASGGKRIRIYDQRSGKDTFNVDGNASLKLSDDPENIAYKRNYYKYDKFLPMLAAGFNKDDGILLGLGGQYLHQGWRKEPFASRQIFAATHALSTKAWNFRYIGEFTDVIGKSDLEVHATAKAPNNTINFFGYGNESIYDKDKPGKIRYYRARFALYSADLLLKTNLSNKFSVAYGPTGSFYSFEQEENQGRFITDFAQNGLDSASIVNKKGYLGGKIVAQLDTRNNKLIATRGVLWTTTFTGTGGLNNYSNNTATLQTDLSIYLSFSNPDRFVLVSRFGGGKVWGNFDYFQAYTVGGSQNLRGFRNYRFAGEAGAYNNTEVRLKLFDVKTYLLPASVGLLLFNDVGRVWASGEKSHVWHDGYGGGLYLSPVNALIVTAVLGHSNEGTLPYFSLGFKF